MKEFTHTEECKAALAKYLKADAEYVIQWPHHCKTCAGWGGFWSSYDPSPSGISLSAGSLEDFDPCPDCVEEGRCPRCGRELPDGYDLDSCEEPCPACGFTFDGKTDGRHEAPECYCWHEAEAALWEVDCPKTSRNCQ